MKKGYYQTFYFSPSTPMKKREELHEDLKRFNFLMHNPPNVFFATDMEMDAFYEEVMELENKLRGCVTDVEEIAPIDEDELEILLMMFKMNGIERIDNDGTSFYSIHGVKRVEKELRYLPNVKTFVDTRRKELQKEGFFNKLFGLKEKKVIEVFVVEFFSHETGEHTLTKEYVING